MFHEKHFSLEFIHRYLSYLGKLKGKFKTKWKNKSHVVRRKLKDGDCTNIINLHKNIHKGIGKVVVVVVPTLI